MIYISVENKNELEELESLISNNTKEKIYIEDEINDESLAKLSKSKMVICDNDIEKVSFFLANKKKVAVYNKNKKSNCYEQLLNNRSLYTYDNKNELLDIINYNNNIKNHKKILKVSLSVVAIAILGTMLAFSMNNINTLEKTPVSKKSEPKEEQKSEQDILNEKRKNMNFKGENIVFFGDSITDYYDLEKYYGDLPVVNSGIAGNQTKDLLNDMENRVIRYNPTKVFLLVGTNDIAFTDLSDDEIANKIEEIADYITKERKNAKIYIESIYPISKEDSKIVSSVMVDVRDNGRIKSINEKVKDKCNEKGYTYIDMYNLLVNDDDNLNLDYTVDGLHMSDKGYELITETLKKYIYNEV